MEEQAGQLPATSSPKPPRVISTPVACFPYTGRCTALRFGFSRLVTLNIELFPPGNYCSKPDKRMGALIETVKALDFPGAFTIGEDMASRET